VTRTSPPPKLVPYVAVEAAPLAAKTIDATEEELALVAAGKMRLPEKPFDIEELERLPKTRMMGNAVTQAVLDEREEGW
jgi:hypothetical protein